MVQRSHTVLMALLASLSAAPFAEQGTTENLEFRNGRWFDGTRFEDRTIYVVDGRFEAARPARVDRVIDLQGGYALPPFGEAHNHNFTGASKAETDALVRRYLQAGVFYVQNPANVPEHRDAIAGTLNAPQSVDVTFANGAITGPRGHPIALYEDLLRETYYAKRVGALPRGWFEGRSYHVVASAGDLDALWPRLLATKPDFIKIILGHSEDYERSLADPSPPFAVACRRCWPAPSSYAHTGTSSASSPMSPRPVTFAQRWTRGWITSRICRRTTSPPRPTRICSR